MDLRIEWVSNRCKWFEAESIRLAELAGKMVAEGNWEEVSKVAAKAAASPRTTPDFPTTKRVFVYW